MKSNETNSHSGQCVTLNLICFKLGICVIFILKFLVVICCICKPNIYFVKINILLYNK